MSTPDDGAAITLTTGQITDKQRQTFGLGKESKHKNLERFSSFISIKDEVSTKRLYFSLALKLKAAENRAWLTNLWENCINH